MRVLLSGVGLPHFKEKTMSNDANEELESTEGNLTSMYMRELDHPILSREEEIRLGTLSLAGDTAAQEEFFRNNMRLVIGVVKKFYTPPGLTFLDLVQEGNVGLLKAVRTYDPKRGTHFSTYAVWCIRGRVSIALRKSFHVKIPESVQKAFKDVRKAERRLMGEIGGEVTDAIIANDLKIPEETVRRLRWGGFFISMDEHFSDETESSRHDTVEHPTASTDVTNPIEHRDLVMKLLALIRSAPDGKITKKNKGLYTKVLSMRYGLPDYENGSCKPQIELQVTQIAEAMNISQDRASTLLKGAHRALRNLGGHLVGS